MNDRFKFRVWNKKYNFYDFCKRKFGILYIQEKFRVSSGYDGEDHPTFCEDVNENYIIEQCTGLRDKNGNLIYEGDILNAMCFEPDCEWHGCQVKVIWDKTAFQFLIFGERPYQILPFDQVMYNAENDGFELIGNIHEQAEQKD